MNGIHQKMEQKISRDERSERVQKGIEGSDIIESQFVKYYENKGHTVVRIFNKSCDLLVYRNGDPYDCTAIEIKEQITSSKYRNKACVEISKWGSPRGPYSTLASIWIEVINFSDDSIKAYWIETCKLREYIDSLFAKGYKPRLGGDPGYGFFLIDIFLPHYLKILKPLDIEIKK